MDILDNNTEYGAVMQEEKMKTTVKIHGSNEVGHAEGWCDSRGCQGQAGGSGKSCIQYHTNVKLQISDK